MLLQRLRRVAKKLLANPTVRRAKEVAERAVAETFGATFTGLRRGW